MTVEIARRPDGLTVASDAMPGVETVSLGVWVKAGTRHETAAVNGIAHLLEHMAFKGTERRSAYAIAEEIEDVGGYLNACTSRESTAYYSKVLADDLALAVDIVADILQYPTFDEQELVREREVVLQEIGQAHDTPDDIIFDHFQETAYPGQAIGWPVLGRSDIVRGLDRASLVDYLGRHYGPQRMVVAAAGKVDQDQLLLQVETQFTALTPDHGEHVETANYSGGEFRQERDLEQIHLLLGFDSISAHHPDYYAANLLSTLLGGGMSSRLFQEVREKRGLAYSVYSFNSSFADGGIFGIYAGTGAVQVTELIHVLCGEMMGLGEAIPEDELQRAKTQLKASYLMSRESSSSRCEQLGQQLLTYGRAIPLEEILVRIEAVNDADINRLLGHLLAGAPTLASIGPVGGIEPFDQIATCLG